MLKATQRLVRQVRPQPPEDSLERLLARQDLGRGASGALVIGLLGIAAWVYASLLFDKYYPWGSILLGWLIGLAVQRYGRGVDYRFPLLAAAVTLPAGVFGSFVIALFLTGREFGMNPLELVNEISLHTVRTFLVRDFGTIGVIYLAFAAVLAAFFAKRRLRRNEAIALRRWRESGKQ